MTTSVFPVSPKQGGKAFSSIYPLQSRALSGSVLIILEQLNGLAVWAIIHSNTFSLCWSIAKDVVRIEKVYLFHGGRRIWPQEQHHNKPSSYGPYSFLSREMTEKMSTYFSHMGSFFSFFVIQAISMLFILKYGKSSEVITSGRYPHTKLQSFSHFPFNLQQFNQAACVGTWALPCALSLLQSHQDFLFACSEDEMWGGEMKQEGEDFRFFLITVRWAENDGFKICQAKLSLEIRGVWRHNPVIYP